MTADHSHLDTQYFIDRYVFNCPFCNRRNVSYWVSCPAGEVGTRSPE